MVTFGTTIVMVIWSFTTDKEFPLESSCITSSLHPMMIFVRPLSMFWITRNNMLVDKCGNFWYQKRKKVHNIIHLYKNKKGIVERFDYSTVRGPKNSEYYILEYKE